MAPTTSNSNKPTSSFLLPKIQDNPEGWGPSQASIPDYLTQIPYAPFSKSDRIGKIADWTNIGSGSTQDSLQTDGQRSARPTGTATATSSSTQQQGPDNMGPDGLPVRTSTRRNFRLGQEAFGTGTASAFAFSLTAEDESSFSVVDRASTAKRPGATGTGQLSFRSSRGRSFNNRGGGFVRGGGVNTRGGRGGGNVGPAGARRKFGYNDRPQRIRDASVQIGPEWRIMEEIDFIRLNKLYYEVEEPTDLVACGSACFYDKSYDRVTTKFEKNLQKFDRTFVNVSTSADPVIADLSKKEEGTAVFATDNILSTLMCAPRSVYSWDIIITKSGNKLFFDKRDGGNFDFVTVNENAAEPPLEAEKDGINTPMSLAQESTAIFHNYSQQVVKESDKFVLPTPNPFQEYASDAEPIASGLYRYRKWDLGDDIALVVRTSIDAVVAGAPAGSGQVAEIEILEPTSSSHPPHDILFATVKTLNEFDSRAPGAGGAPEWRQKLDSQRGAIVATEVKNNGNKLSRWTTEAVLAGADQIRVGFVSRAHPKDASKHAVLGTAVYKPREFAGQMNLNLGNGWGILRTFVDLVLKYDDGKYVMVKDPNKPMVRLYSVPSTAFEEEEVEESVVG